MTDNGELYSKSRCEDGEKEEIVNKSLRERISRGGFGYGWIQDKLTKEEKKFLTWATK